jgi:pyridoxamine 5'-phosphate oxidase
MSEQWVPLDVADVDADPFVQFHRWFDEAQPLVREREAIALATVGADGMPHQRMVLLRDVNADGFGWFTNYDSTKGRDLAAHAQAALLWYCEPLGRQIRIEGTVSSMSAAESDAYYASRPRGHQIGAHASNQSQRLSSRAELEDRVRELTEQFDGHEIPRPPHWGGYRLRPVRFEFWEHRSDRLHDRVIYEPSATGWERFRTSP